MNEVIFPYGKTKVRYQFGEELQGVLTSSIEEYCPSASEKTLVESAMKEPIGSPALRELAKDKKTVVIIASDHTRPVPSKVIMPVMLREIREGNPDADITILIATGCHRGTTKEELIGKFGEEIVANEKIYIHNCDEREKLINIGTLPSGGVCEINTIAYNADLLVAEGFIEPHFFAGFSGGRKSVLPGIAGRTTVLANHCSEFINHEHARTGILEQNPIHQDMLWAAKTAKLAFVVNVVLNAEKEVIYAVAGDPEKAHKKGTDFLSSLCGSSAIPADVVISTNGGYPLDQNVYQAVKGMTAAEATVKKDGVIIMLAASGDGIGGDHFYHQLADEPDIQKTMDLFLKRSRNETVPDQWQSQILIRILMHAKVIYVSEMADNLVEKMHMIPAHSLDEAIHKAKQILNKETFTVTAIPDGVAVMVRK
ncbi:MAG: nickel-dependent lactate racemase [Ruminococcaceae bacterium]|nr:nickel-dependent lactate racemase [Oscillospiraceae bacterium]